MPLLETNYTLSKYSVDHSRISSPWRHLNCSKMNFLIVNIEQVLEVKEICNLLYCNEEKTCFEPSREMTKRSCTQCDPCPYFPFNSMVTHFIHSIFFTVLSRDVTIQCNRKDIGWKSYRPGFECDLCCFLAVAFG